jgi:hypothetical protein
VSDASPRFSGVRPGRARTSSPKRRPVATRRHYTCWSAATRCRRPATDRASTHRK